jgi:hypothetical protein
MKTTQEQLIEKLKEWLYFDGKQDCDCADCKKWKSEISALEKQIEQEEEQQILYTDSVLCDICGCHPAVVIRTNYGTFCHTHAKYS